MKKLQVAGFLDNSAVNGEGLRSVIFLSGCYHQCPECHNQDMQNPTYGEQVSLNDILFRIQGNIPIINGVTISGGEPFLQWENLLHLLQKIKLMNISTWVYTGYAYEDICSDKNMKFLLPLIDVLVDGPFIKEQYSPDYLYIGSKNQRILQLNNGKIIEQIYY